MKANCWIPRGEEKKKKLNSAGIRQLVDSWIAFVLR